MQLNVVQMERLQLRLDPAIEDTDGTIVLVLNGTANDNWPKQRFDPHGVNGYDDGDPCHW